MANHQQGVCPICQSTNLEYKAADFVDNSVFFPWECEDCHATGKEFYSMTFDKHYSVSEHVDAP